MFATRRIQKLLRSKAITIKPGLPAARLSVLQLQPHRSLEGGQLGGIFIQKCTGPCFCIGNVTSRTVKLIKRHGQQRDDTSVVITVIPTVSYHLQRIRQGQRSRGHNPTLRRLLCIDIVVVQISGVVSLTSLDSTPRMGQIGRVMHCTHGPISPSDSGFAKGRSCGFGRCRLRLHCRTHSLGNRNGLPSPLIGRLLIRQPSG